MRPLLSQAARLTSFVPGAIPQEMSLFRHGVRYFCGEAGTKFLAFAFFIVIANIVPVEQFGYINIFTSSAAILASVSGLGLQHGIIKFYYTDNSFSQVLGTSILLSLIAWVAFAAAAWAIRDAASHSLNVPPLVISLATLMALGYIMKGIYLSSLKARQESARYASFQIADPLVLLAVVACATLLLRGSLNYAAVISAFTLSAAIIASYGVFSLSRNPGLRLNWHLSSKLLVFSLPLIFHALGGVALGSADQIIIGHLRGPGDTGLYAYAYRFGMAMLIVNMAVSSMWLPHFLKCKSTQTGPEEINSLAQKCSNAILAIAASLCIILPVAASLVARADYQQAIYLIPLIVYGYMWHYGYSLVAAYYVNHSATVTIAIGTIFAALLNVSLNYLFIPSYGIAAAAIATIISYFVLFLFQLVVAARSFSLDIDFSTIFAKLAIFGAVPLAMSALY